MFLQLFGTESALELLNRTAPEVFSLCQDALFDSLVAAIGRLADPAQTGGNHNLSLLHLVERVDTSKYPDVAKELLAANEKVVQTYEPVKQVRNRLISHLDLRTCMDPKSLPIVARNEIGAVVEAIVGLMDLLDRHFCGAPVVCRDLASGGGDRLLKLLHDAEKYLEDQADIHSANAALAECGELIPLDRVLAEFGADLPS